MLGGQFMAIKWEPQRIFLVAAVSALVMLSLRWVLKPSQSEFAVREPVLAH